MKRLLIGGALLGVAACSGCCWRPAWCNGNNGYYQQPAVYQPYLAPGTNYAPAGTTYAPPAGTTYVPPGATTTVAQAPCLCN